jgi:hypothetical protein
MENFLLEKPSSFLHSEFYNVVISTSLINILLGDESDSAQ